MVIVGVDGYALSGHRAGVGNYCAGLLKHVALTGDDLQLRLLAYRVRGGPSDPVADFADENVEVVSRPRTLTRATELAHRSNLGVRYELLLPGADVYFFTRYWRPSTRKTPALTMVYDLSCFVARQAAEPHKARQLRRDIRRTVQSSQAVGIISESVGREMLDRFPEVSGRLVLLRPGSSELIASSSTDANTPLRRSLPHRYLLHVGTLEPRKNLLVLIEAIRLLADGWMNSPPVPLVLVGRRGWLDEDILRAVHDAGPLVHWIDDVSDSELPAIYAHAEATVVASRYEGFGLPVLEAMTAGSVVVCSDIPVFREVGGPAPIYVDTSDAKRVANALHEAVDADETFTESRKKLGRDRAVGFSWNHAASIFVKSMIDLAVMGSLSDEVQWCPG